MKKLLGLLVAVAFFVSGCVVGLTSLKPDTDCKKVIKTVMNEVDKCTPDENGWKILEIKDKRYSENWIKFVAFKHLKEGWGVGLVSDKEMVALTLSYVPKQDQWYVMSWMGVQPVSKIQSDQWLKEWSAALLKDGDLTTAKTFEMTPQVREAPKTDL